MKFLKGLSRKLVIPLLAIFFLGWLLCFVGFMLQVHNAKGKTTFYFIPEILASASGPILVVVGFLHAAFSGPISAFLGTVTAFVSVFGCMGFGFNMFDLYSLVYSRDVLSKSSVVVKSEDWLELVGSTIASVSLMCVLIAWNCFSYEWKFIQVDTIVDEDGNFVDNSYLTRIRRNIIFAGFARKLASVILLLLGASWCLYVAGVINESRTINATIFINTSLPVGSLSVPLPFSTWSTCVVGLFAILSAVGHAGSYGGASTAMGVFTAILGMFFVASVGYVALSKALQVHFSCQQAIWNCYILDTTIPKYIIYQLSGALGMCVWWACLAALWPFYFRETEVVQRARREQRIYQQYGSQQVQQEEQVPLL